MPLQERLDRTRRRGYVPCAIVSSVALCGVIAPDLLRAQSTPPSSVSPPPSIFVARNVEVFDVVSVKPNRSGTSQVQMGGSQPGGRWIMVNNFVTNAIYWAYPGETGEYVNLPDWARTERFDIEAKVDGVPGILDRESLRAPMRALLADRFKFVAHYEARQRRVYELTRTKPREPVAPSLRRVDIDCDEHMMRQKVANKPAMVIASTGAPVCGVMNVGGAFRSGGITMSTFADVLGGIIGTPVRDKTELEGVYEFTLAYDNKPLSTTVTTPSGKPTIFEAVQAHLGLRLESRQSAVDVLVIDRLERPTAN